MMELALIENLQRKDLSAFEEADGLKMLAETYGYTHEAMAEKLGKSRTSITEIARADRDARGGARASVGWPTFIPSRCCCRSFVSPTPQKMIALVERLQQRRRARATGARRHRARSEGEGRARAGRATTSSATSRARRASRSSLQFRKSQVPRDEIVRALQAIIDELEAQLAERSLTAPAGAERACKSTLQRSKLIVRRRSACHARTSSVAPERAR